MTDQKTTLSEFLPAGCTCSSAKLSPGFYCPSCEAEFAREEAEMMGRVRAGMIREERTEAGL